MTAETAIHCFEKAGLGKARFTCVGMYSIPSPSLAEANPTAYNLALSEMPKGLHCGSCAYCGTPIMHNFIIASADGRRFVVGSDCVARTGDAGLVKEVKRVRVTAKREARQRVRDASAAERKALWAAERAERAVAFVAANEALLVRADAFRAESPFVNDVLTSGAAGAYVSDKALAAVVRVIEDLERTAARRANSRHVGTVGKRQTFAVTVDRVASFGRPSFAGYGSETVYVVTMQDADGNCIVVKSTAFCPEKGEALTIKATVKEHGEYKGEKQTVVQRVAVQ